MSTKQRATAESAQVVERASLPLEELELLDQFDRETVVPRGAYGVEFADNSMIFANRFTMDIRSILTMDSETISGFKSTIKSIAGKGSLSPGTLAGYVRNIASTVRKSPVLTFTSINYPTLIATRSNETVIAFRSILNAWYRLGMPGISLETINVVNDLKRPATQGRKRINSDDVTEGWYTTEEYEQLIDVYWTDFETEKANLRDTTALLLNAQYARRGIQLANLKVSDFQSEGETDGISGKRVAFPSAKDRTAEQWFRGSKFEVHPVGEDLWNLCAQQIHSTIHHHEVFFGRELSAEERYQLPVFQKDFKSLKKYKDFKFKLAKEEDSSTSVFHVHSSVIATILGKRKGTKVISMRTGEPLREFAYRMRYTRARQLARLGVPRTTLSYWLGHEGNGSLEHYYDDPAENARILDIEMRVILAPLAQAFLGSLRDTESDAIRGDDPSSRIELDGSHNVGTCGEHGFCSASVPIPCYRCSKFQPWVNAPHEEVLIRLIERQQEENNIHIPSKGRRILIPLQLEKDIAAVQLVIQLCDARKREIASGQMVPKTENAYNHTHNDNDNDGIEGLRNKLETADE